MLSKGSGSNRVYFSLYRSESLLEDMLQRSFARIAKK